MSYSLRYWLLGVLCLCSLDLMADTVQLSFKVAQVRGQAVWLLGDMATIQVDDPSLADKLATFVVQLPPKSTVFKSAELVAQLQQAFAGHEWRWRGNTSLGVDLTMQAIPWSTLVEQAQRFLEQQLQRDYLLYEIKPTTTVDEPLLFKAGQLSYTTRFDKGCQIKAATCVWVDVKQADGKVLQSKVVWFQVSVFDAVFVAKQALKANRPLQADEVELLVQDILALPEQGISDLNKIQGMQLKVPLQQGQIIPPSLLIAVPDVQREQSIIVRLHQMAIALETQGVAQQSGYVGDVIRVKVSGAHQAVKAKIVARGEVEVAE